MREEGFKLVEDGDKYYVLIDLYNDWNIKTCFLSSGNCHCEEWDKMLEYCKEHKLETLNFFLDLIECFEESRKEGFRANNFVGFFNDIVYECFKDDEIFPTFEGYIPGPFIQKTYSIFANIKLKRISSIEAIEEYNKLTVNN